MCILQRYYYMEQRHGSKKEESKLQAAEMNFLRVIVEKSRGRESETHTLRESSRWKKHRTKL
jgi:hypothetical protein